MTSVTSSRRSIPDLECHGLAFSVRRARRCVPDMVKIKVIAGPLLLAVRLIVVK